MDSQHQEVQPATQPVGQLIGQGRTAEIFAYGDGQVLKLFRAGMGAASVGREAERTRAVHQAGLPAPAVAGVVRVGLRLGIEFERVEGPSMLRRSISRPWTLFKAAGLLAELHSRMHQTSVAELPPQKERLAQSITSVEDLPERARKAALYTLDRLPSGDAVCHGDFHPDNVIMSQRGPVIIDWSIATRGSPLADVARTSLMLTLGSVPDFVPVRRLLSAMRHLFHFWYLRRYMRLRDVRRDEIAQWTLPVVVARLREGIPGERDHLLRLIDDLVVGSG